MPSRKNSKNMISAKMADSQIPLSSKVDPRAKEDQKKDRRSAEAEEASGRRPTASAEEELVQFALGDMSCKKSTTSKVIHYLAVAVIGALLFIILSLPQVDAALAVYIPDLYHRIIAKGLIFLVVIYLLDRAISNWRLNNAICD